MTSPLGREENEKFATDFTILKGLFLIFLPLPQHVVVMFYDLHRAKQEVAWWELTSICGPDGGPGFNLSENMQCHAKPKQRIAPGWRLALHLSHIKREERGRTADSQIKMWEQVWVDAFIIVLCWWMVMDGVSSPATAPLCSSLTVIMCHYVEFVTPWCILPT